MKKLEASKSRWEIFRHPDPHFVYEGTALRRHWPRLHRGDCEPFPDRNYLQRLTLAHPALEPSLPLSDLAGTLQDAWRAYHRGAFEEAVQLGLAAGPLGYNVANKATNIYATYLEPDDQDAISLFRCVAQRAEGLQHSAPKLANAWYFHAQALGRYSQRISIGAALAEGVAEKVKRSLDKTIALEPRHADARIALGAFQAEIIAKAGSLIASLTYGATKDAAIESFQEALRLDPDSAIARIEYGEALILIHGRAQREAAKRLFGDAASRSPADAMEFLDIALAKAKLAH